MNDHIEFHIGPRKCGKSEFVEKKLSIFKNKIYLATLPKQEKYIETIKAHRKRRGNNWNSIELTFNIKDDFIMLNKQFSLMPKDTACMIDGLLTWFIHSFKGSITQLNLDSFIQNLVELINSFDFKWWLIDVDVSYYSEREKDIDFTMFKNLHHGLIEKLKINKIIDWKYENF